MRIKKFNELFSASKVASALKKDLVLNYPDLIID